MTPSLCILIPVYNCYDALAKLLPQVLSYSLPVCVIDDGSTLIPEWIRSQTITLITHESNRGKGAALKTGFAWALQQGYDGVITMDGDAQHDPGDLINFIHTATEYDVVVGKRDFTDPRMPAHRKFSNTVTSKMLTRLLHTPILDAQCGYRCISSNVLNAITLETDKYDMENELLIKAVRKGFRIGFVPIHTIYNDSASHIHGFRDTYRFLRAIVKYGFRKV